MRSVPTSDEQTSAHPLLAVLAERQSLRRRRGAAPSGAGVHAFSPSAAQVAAAGGCRPAFGCAQGAGGCVAPGAGAVLCAAWCEPSPPRLHQHGRDCDAHPRQRRPLVAARRRGCAARDQLGARNAGRRRHRQQCRILGACFPARRQGAACTRGFRRRLAAPWGDSLAKLYSVRCSKAAGTPRPRARAAAAAPLTCGAGTPSAWQC